MPERRNSQNLSYLGVGVYSATQAARLIHAAPLSIRRWLGGYENYPPLWTTQLPATDGQLRLGFLDLMELRFVREFRGYGVSLQHIRKVIRKARDLIRPNHPLSTRTFRTDGRDILADVANETGDHRLLNLRNEQWGFEEAIGPSIVADVVFSDNDWAEQWWPVGRDRGIVIDPKRAFGQPILARFGIPTRMVAITAKTEGDFKKAADILGISREAARDALDFEHAFAV